MVGHQKLGQSVPIEGVRDGAYRWLRGPDYPLWRRVQIVTWLSRSLTKAIVGKHELARDILLEAGEEMSDWQEGDGKQVLEYFLGREYLALHQLKQAEESYGEAKKADPNYVNAYIGLGNVYLDKASFYFLSPKSSSSDENMCEEGRPSAKDLDANAGQIPLTASEALSATNQAIVYYEDAVKMAPSSAWKPMKTVARYMLGRGYRLRGTAAWSVSPANWSQANADLLRAKELISPTLQQFEDDKLYGFLAYAYFDLAWAERTSGDIYRRQRDSASDAAQAEAQREEAIAAYKRAYESYLRCIEQEKRIDGDDPKGSKGMQTTIACDCKEGEQNMLYQIGDLGGASG